LALDYPQNVAAHHRQGLHYSQFGAIRSPPTPKNQSVTLRDNPKNDLNPLSSARFDDFLKEEGMFEEVRAKALKRALAEQLEESMEAAKLTKLEMAKKMATSHSQLDRVLDPSNVSAQLGTLMNAARALGKR
jgi:hypothetical protein